MTSGNAVGVLLGRVRVWWRKQEVLGALDRKEGGRVDADLGTSINALNDLFARGPTPQTSYLSVCERWAFRKPTSIVLRRA